MFPFLRLLMVGGGGVKGLCHHKMAACGARVSGKISVSSGGGGAVVLTFHLSTLAYRNVAPRSRWFGGARQASTGRTCSSRDSHFSGRVEMEKQEEASAKFPRTATMVRRVALQGTRPGSKQQSH